MITRPFKDIRLSMLGMGAMRLPTNGEGFDAPVDEAKAREIIEYVYGQGVNYFDTAFVYHGGESERVLGRALAQYPRESFYLADKLWYQSLTPDRSVREIFEIQLERCGVEYFDFYLLHNISDTTIDDYMQLDKTHGVMAYLEGEKKAGRIKHLGFSCHSSPENLARFLDFYPFDFVQIQCNYVDWTLQDAKSKYELLTERNIPVIVMEPCRGGALANLDEAQAAPLQAARPGLSTASWAFRFLQSLDNVAVVLSGMSTLEQAEDNVKTFGELQPLGEPETQTLQGVVDSMLTLVPCTACRYCHACPQKLDIPSLIELYNEASFDISALRWELPDMPEAQKPHNCIACGACTKVCPQSIDIPDVLARLDVLFGQFAGG